VSSNPTIAISLTTFVDFVTKTGTPRITTVQTAKRQVLEGYDPARDYWKRLREAIVQYHSTPWTIQRLRAEIASVTAANKVANYRACLDDYLRWAGRKNLTWFQFQCNNYTHGGLRVRVNPELHLKINGEPHLVKLYFKAGGLCKRAVDPILYLIETCSRRIGSRGKPTPAVLDIRRRKLHTPTRQVPNISALLQGEAAAFETIYRQLP